MTDKTTMHQLEKINRQWEEKSNYIDWKLLEEDENIEKKAIKKYVKQHGAI